MDGRATQARQHPAILPALIALVLAAACAPARPAASSARKSDASAVSRRAAACSAEGLPVPHWSDLPAQAIPAGAKVSAITVRGTGAVPARLVRARIHAKTGKPLDPEVVAGDIRRIWGLEAFSGVRAEAETDDGRVTLVYAVTRRTLVGRVFSDGHPDAGLGVHPGDLYEPARLQRRARAFVSTARDEGYLQARAEVRGRRAEGGRVDLCLAVSRGSRFLVDRIAFEGNYRVDDATLLDALHTGDGKVNTVGKPYRADLLAQDSVWLSAIYFDRGMVSVHVDKPRITLDDKRHTVTVHIRVSEGPVFRFGRLGFRGHLIARPATYRRLLGVKRGQVFDRTRLAAGIGRIRDYHLWRGRRSLEVESGTHLDTARRLVYLVIKVEKAK